MDITVTLTEEQAAALSESTKSGRGRMMLRRMGIKGNIEPKTAEEIVNTMVKGMADEHIRRPSILETFRKGLIAQKTMLEK